MSCKCERDAAKKRGKIPPWKDGIHPRGMLGKKSWNNGQTTPAHVRELLRQTLTDNPKCKGIASTPEKEALRKQRIRAAAKRNGKMGGLREGSGWTKWFLHESPFAGRVFLNGTWEVAYAQYLDNNQIEWRRNKQGFHYDWEEKQRKYFPDFYLVKTDEFIEIKGRIVPVDYVKWETLRKTQKLTVLFHKNLTELGLLQKIVSLDERHHGKAR